MTFGLVDTVDRKVVSLAIIRLSTHPTIVCKAMCNSVSGCNFINSMCMYLFLRLRRRRGLRALEAIGEKLGDLADELCADGSGRIARKGRMAPHPIKTG